MRTAASNGSDPSRHAKLDKADNAIWLRAGFNIPDLGKENLGLFVDEQSKTTVLLLWAGIHSRANHLVARLVRPLVEYSGQIRSSGLHYEDVQLASPHSKRHAGAMTVVNRTNTPHYKWAQICEGWRLLDGDDLSVIEELMPPKTREERHLHNQANQLFFVLDGLLTVEIAGVLHHLTARDALNVKPGQAHQVRNDSETEAVRFLVISSPTSRGDRLAAQT